MAATISVFYDGGCHLCSKEIAIYQQKDKEGQIHFVDINQPDFDAKACGLDPEEVLKNFHVKDSNGKIHIGVNAFIKIWQTLEDFHWLAKVASFPAIKITLEMAYPLFAKIRPLLPRKNTCDNGKCAY